ncbi:MAG: hypothetical protein AB1896_02740 [Thermodesulfobacteriota bacterium]
MTDPVHNGPPSGPLAYTSQVRRLAWRDEMLSQVLEKVRYFAPDQDLIRLAAPDGPPPKGSVVDIIV